MFRTIVRRWSTACLGALAVSVCLGVVTGTTLASPEYHDDIALRIVRK